MQRLQLSRGLAVFSQTRMGEQCADIVRNSLEQIAIIGTVRLAMQWMTERHERLELSLRANGKTQHDFCVIPISLPFQGQTLIEKYRSVMAQYLRNARMRTGQ